MDRFRSAGLRRRARDSVRWGAGGLIGEICFEGTDGTLDRPASVAVKDVGRDEDVGLSLLWVYKLGLRSSGGDAAFLVTLTTTRGFWELFSPRMLLGIAEKCDCSGEMLRLERTDSTSFSNLRTSDGSLRETASIVIVTSSSSCTSGAS